MLVVFRVIGPCTCDVLELCNNKISTIVAHTDLDIRAYVLVLYGTYKDREIVW